MAPPTSTPSDTSSDTPTPSATLGIQIVIAVTLPLVFLSLLVLKAVVFYRKRAQREKAAGGQSVLSVGVTVDVAKVVDLPYETKDQTCRGWSRGHARRATVAYAGTLSSLNSHSCRSSMSSLKLHSGEMTPTPCASESSLPLTALPHPLPRVPLGSYFKTYPSCTGALTRSRLFPLGSAFSAMDVDGLTESTVRFPRLPPTLDDDPSVLTGYPTIPSIPSTSVPPMSCSIVTASDDLDDFTKPNHGLDVSHPGSDDSLGTLVDSLPRLLEEGGHDHVEAACDSNNLEKRSSVIGDRPSTPNVQLDESSPIVRRPISSYSPLVAMSLSPLRTSISPAALSTTPHDKDPGSEARGSPDLDAFVTIASPLLDESPPDSPQTVVSVGTCRRPRHESQDLSTVTDGDVTECKYPGRVLQPLFENSISFDYSQMDFAHLSIASLRSASTLSRSAPTRFSLASLSRPPSFKATPSTRTSMALDNASPAHTLPKVALSSPVASFHVSLSPSISADITAAYSPSLLGSPFQRPRAPTPGSVDSRFFSYDYPHDADPAGPEHRTVFLAPLTYDRSSSRLSASYSYESFSHSPSSPYSRPRAPTPGSTASISPRPDIEDTPQLLPPLNLDVIPSLSL